MTTDQNTQRIDRLCEAAAVLEFHGFKVLPLHNGKSPKLKDWQHRDFSPEALRGHLLKADVPGVGVQLGPCSGVVDIEWDTAEQYEAARELIGDDLLDAAPAFGRPGDDTHQHRLFAWDTRLEQTQRANINVPCESGEPLIVRVGAAGKATQSAFPPSPNKAWLPGRSIDDCQPPQLPDSVIKKLIAIAAPRETTTPSTATATAAPVHAALAAMLKHRPEAGESDGSKRLFAVACRAVEHNLSDDDALTMIRLYEQTYPLPRDWSDAEVTLRLRQAEQRPDCQRGSYLTTTNYKTTDLGNAERFAAHHGDKARWCEQLGQWYIWDGKRWKPDVTREVVRLATQVVRHIYDEARHCEDSEVRAKLAKHAAKSESRSAINAVVDLAKSQPPIPTTVESLDTDPYLLNCPNGTIDLTTGKLQPHSQGDLITKITACEYDAHAVPARWVQFLDEVFAGDQELIDFVQRLLGYSLIGDVIEHVFPICYGGGANGKTTLLNTVRELLGDYAVSLMENLLKKKTHGDSHPTELMDLFQARFALMEETDQSQQLNMSRVKRLASNGTLRARKCGQDSVEFKQTHTLFMDTNHKPVIEGQTEGDRRRIVIVPFIVQVPVEKRDSHLPAKLHAEAPAILGWLVRGCLAYQKQGLNPPAKVLAITNEYRNESDSFSQFVTDRCELSPDKRAYRKPLYEAYRWYCDDAAAVRLNSTQFKERVLGVPGVKDGGRDKTGFHYTGIAHVDDHDGFTPID